MQITLVTPAPPGSLSGNRVTAERWCERLRELGHQVEARESGFEEVGGPDLLVALHAKKSAPTVERFAARFPGRPIVVALTGTDLYSDASADFPADAATRRALELADRLVALQARAGAALPPDLRSKVRVIHQSLAPPSRREAPREDVFEVCVSAHLRAVKDPFLAAEAVRRLPEASRIRVLHLGAALDAEHEARAREESRSNPRWSWLGPLPREEALAVLARCRLLALTSRAEGGANVVSEAIVCGVPVISTAIEGSIGLLGEHYPGFFPVADAAALGRLLLRCEREPAFLGELARRCAALAPLFTPEREREAWAALLAEISG